MLNPRLVAVIRKVVPHIRQGCVSDPAPESYSMHIVARRSKDGLIKTRSNRGTNNVENFHKYYNGLV